MPVLHALGLGIAIIVLRLLTPLVLTQMEDTAIAFLKGAEVSAVRATDLTASIGTTSFYTDPGPLVLPQASQIVSE